MINKNTRERLQKKKSRVRSKIVGTTGRPRLSVTRTLKHIYAQIIDDTTGKTLVAASSNSKELQEQVKTVKSPIERGKIVGKFAGQKAMEKKITQVVFDRNGMLYHGRVKAVADGAREAGLKF